MTGSFPYIGGAYLGWQLGNVILGKPVDPGMVFAGVAFSAAALIITVYKSMRSA